MVRQKESIALEIIKKRNILSHNKKIELRSRINQSRGGVSSVTFNNRSSKTTEDVRSKEGGGTTQYYMMDPTFNKNNFIS